ncbi:uncharacterized protein LOC135369738, partial [Ornithodoros turicata]|uniref:uncharacterized protein LOC135369738 n=1 Tax=Ornithodoros turicata TaxID=34597 RepID=UPI003139927A
LKVLPDVLSWFVGLLYTLLCGTLVFLPGDDSRVGDHEAAQKVNDCHARPLEQDVTLTLRGGGPPDSKVQDDSPRLLPAPRWSEDPIESLTFQTDHDLQKFVEQVKLLLQRELCDRRYNTMGNLLHFYRSYCGQAKPESLERFYCRYKPQVFEDGLSCVGLALHLSEELVRTFPGAAPFLVSCEEMVQDVDSYCRADPPDNSSIKEHVLVGLSVSVRNRSRKGIVVLDPGYHVALPVVVMEDGLPPHTGRFVQSNTSKSTKEYCYTSVPETAGRYMCWNVTEARAGSVKTWNNILYVGSDFKSALSYSEMRNLVYDFRTLVARDKRGPTAGVYCKLAEVNRNPIFTLFYVEQGNRRELKVPFCIFSSNFLAPEPDADVEAAIEECAAQVGMDIGEMIGILSGMAELYDNVDFVTELLDLNHRVDPSDA